MKFIYPFLISAFLCLTGTLAGQENAVNPLDAEIKKWIEKLGDDSFFVRQRAEEHLFRIGFDALAELQKASTGKDVEVARRAEKIIARFEHLSVRQENGALQFWIKQYAAESSVTAKAGIIWVLSGPSFDAPQSEGLPTLLRIVQFDENRSLRAEAAKVLIGLPPIQPSLQKKWYQKTSEGLNRNSGSEQDDIIALVTAFANVRNELEERNTPPDAGLVQQVRDLSEKMPAFLSKPEYDAVQPGNFIDILFYYALAEIQDAVGLTAERDKTVQTAVAVRTEELGKEHPLMPVNEMFAEPFYDHYEVTQILRSRYRLNWAKQHGQLVLENSSLIQKIDAALTLAKIEQFLCRFPEAIKYYEQASEWVRSQEYKNIRSDSQKILNHIQRDKSLCWAYQAEQANDWAKVREHTEAGLKIDRFEIDLLILSYKAVQDDPELALRRKGNLRVHIDEAVLYLERQMRIAIANAPQRRKTAAATACNQAAWLLAGTDGNYSEAKSLIDAAVKAEPEEPTFLDTLAHVYFLGGEYEKAVQTQQTVVQLAPEAVVFRNALERFQQRSK